jgi:hypothetical protein
MRLTCRQAAGGPFGKAMRMRFGARWAASAVAAAAAAALSACGAPEVGPTADALLTQNGLSANGLSANGLSANGMSANGLSANGLSANGLSAAGLSTADFTAWFLADPQMGDMVMRYLAKCALPAGQTLSYWWNGRVYRWRGVLGLAPGWADGPLSVAEQQLVTACLAAHSNKFGLHIALSVRGPLADGVSLVQLDPGEDAAFPRGEGCFFGNLFDGSGIYSGAFLDVWQPDETNPRGCAVESDEPGSCPPIQSVGNCAASCTEVPGVTPTVWGDCVANGVHYLPLTTYLAPDSIYTCGDGVCQFTESPYDPATGTGCATDCGSL